MTPAPSDQTAPTRPLGLGSSELTATSVRLTWTGSIDLGGSHLAGYNVYRGVRPVGTVGVGVVTFVDGPLVPNSGYTYTVRSFDNAQNHSTPSNSVSLTTLSAAGDATAPGIPLNLQGRALSHSQVRLDWHASTDAGGSGLAGYKVYRGGALISGGSPIPATSYTDSTVVANTAYAYTLTAVDGNGNASAATAAVNVTTPLELLFKDDFNRPNTTTPTLGTGWNVHALYPGFYVDALRAGCGSSYGLCVGVTNSSPTHFKVSAWATPGSGGSGVPSGGIAFWHYGSGQQFYRAVLRVNGYLQLEYYRSDFPLYSELLAYDPVGATGTIMVEADSATANIKVYFNGVLRIDFTDTTARPYPRSGAVGISSSPGYLIDDFAAYRLP